MTEVNDNYKIVNMTYTEMASIVVKADTDDEAISAVESSFSQIPDLKIVSIEEADEETVNEVLRIRQENHLDDIAEKKRTLN